MPDALFLVPGYGAQGASAEDAVAGFIAGKQGLEGGVVSSSRAVLYPEGAQAAKNMEEWRGIINDAMAGAAAELRAACTR
jgi:orotidine-5'-phosphate decarboxylase